ncbi:MAG: hypothetical protein HRU00_15375, partial [Myxococcales bacterium]|nr:hypothetical protein [Myxococcales bacterium]
SSGTGTDEIAFGNPAIGINATRFFQWHWNNNPLFFQPGNSGGLSGLPINIYPYPIRDAGNSLGPMRLAATRGPALRTQTFDVDPAYDYGISQIFPTSSPSPDNAWRSTDKTEQIIVMDMGAEGMLGPVWGAALHMSGCNFRTAFLESSTHGISWTARGTWDAAEGFAGLEYERNGDRIQPDTAGAGVAPGRLLNRNEVVAAGGYALLDGTHPVRVVQSGAGRWDSSTIATMRPNCRVELVGGEGIIGTVDLCLPRGVLLYIYPGAAPADFDRFWRIRIPANQITPDAYYQIGVATVGAYSIYGKRTSSGWSDEKRPNVLTETTRNGTLRQRQQGKLARQWTLGWSDGVSMADMRTVDPDYVTGGADQPRGLRADVPWLMHGVLEELKSGQVPCIAVQVGSGAQMITDRTAYLYGLITSTLQTNHVSGDDGRNEFVRVDTITVDELV